MCSCVLQDALEVSSTGQNKISKQTNIEDGGRIRLREVDWPAEDVSDNDLSNEKSIPPFLRKLLS